MNVRMLFKKNENLKLFAKCVVIEHNSLYNGLCDKEQRPAMQDSGGFN